MVGKLNMESIKKVKWENYQGYIENKDQFGNENKKQKAGAQESITKKNFGRFCPKLKERTEELEYPSMLKLCCNSVEVVRLRSTLI